MNTHDAQIAFAILDDETASADYSYEAPTTPHLVLAADPARDDDGVGVYSIGTILPEQFFADTRGIDDALGERGLMLAVLEDAIRNYQDHLHSSRVRPRLLARQAERWISSEDTSWPFSFENICSSLEIEPAGLRAKVLQPRAHRASRTARPSTHRVYRLTPRVKASATG